MSQGRTSGPTLNEGDYMPNKAHQRWVAEHTTRIVMNLNHNTDADLLAKLETVPSKQGYIKQLIRDAIAKEQAEAIP